MRRYIMLLMFIMLLSSVILLLFNVECIFLRLALFSVTVAAFLDIVVVGDISMRPWYDADLWVGLDDTTLNRDRVVLLCDE